MDIRLAKIEKSEISFLEKLDPLFILERIILPEYFAMAAAIPGIGSEEDTPVGLIVGHLSQDTVYVDWLCVAEGYRGEGIGEKLLVRTIEAAKNAGSSSVIACFDSRVDREELCAHEEIYFKERDFSGWTPLEDEWEILTGALLKNCSEGADDGMRMEPLTDYPEQERQEILKECLESPEGARFIPYTLDMIDSDISFFSEYKGKGIAALFSGHENVVFPLFLSDTADRAKAALIKAAAGAIKKKYGPDSRVILKKDSHTSTFPQWIFGKKNMIDCWGLEYEF